MSAQDAFCVLCAVWQTIQDCFDLTADPPGWDCVLGGVDLSHPIEAARLVLINLLVEAMERVGRFNPLYKASPEAFGLYRQAQATPAASYSLQLMPEAMEQWRPTLDALARAIANDPDLPEIQATFAVSDWLTRPLIAATCACEPAPPVTWVPPHMLLESVLYCSICGQPLRRVEPAT